MNLFGMLSMGRQTLLAQRMGLQTAQDNISNVNTPGYARRRVDFRPGMAAKPGGNMVGFGVTAARVSGLVDQFTEQQVLGARSRASGQAVIRELELYTETNMSSPAGTLTAVTGVMLDSWAELTAEPTDLNLRTDAVVRSDALATRLNDLSLSLRDHRDELDSRVREDVLNVNRILHELSELNRRLPTLEANGSQDGGLRTRQNQLIQELSDKVPVRVRRGTGGKVEISVAGHLLLRDRQVRDLTVRVGGGGYHELGVQTDNGFHPLPDFPAEGSLGASIRTRDERIPELLNELDVYAYTLATEVNTRHQSGFDLNGAAGLQVFTDVVGVQGAAAAIQVNTLIADDASLVAAAGVVGSSGNNDVARLIQDLDRAQVMGSRTLEGFATDLMSNVALRSRDAESAQLDLQAELDSFVGIREAVSGVSLEEENIDLTRFQRAYEAGARSIQTAQTLFDTLLRL